MPQSTDGKDSATGPVRKRLRELGISIGRYPTGTFNAITDVSGVLVGHETVFLDEPHVVRSGVTTIVPEGGEIWYRHLFGGSHVLNGNGEMTGLVWLDEFGMICGPIAITSTHSVGAVHEGMVSFELPDAFTFDFRLPLVAETCDYWLSDPAALAVRPEHVHRALRNASSGPVPEGNVGGGTGMNAHEFKAGIGTSSRLVDIDGQPYTVGVLVQANYGRRERLMLDGCPVGEALCTEQIPSPWQDDRDEGSIIAIVATDAPLLPQQCQRLAQRCSLGVARVGGLGAPGSGDIFLAFSTGNACSETPRKPMHTVRFMHDMILSGLLEATIEATEESIWNALCGAETITGHMGRTSHAIPLDALADIVDRTTRFRTDLCNR